MIFIFNNTRIITIMIVLLTSILSTKSLRIYKNNLIIRNVKKHSTSNSESSILKCEVCVIGGGHAGCEAATAAARTGAKTFLVTQSKDSIGEMSCNPSIGGIGKGHLVKEIDALDGVMGKVIDNAGIHFKMLNIRKGPAVRGPRAQADRDLYKAEMYSLLSNYPNLHIVEGTVEDLLIDDITKSVGGVKTKDGREILTSNVIITTGTFLRGRCYLGRTSYPAGRHMRNSDGVEPPSIGLALTLERLKFPLERLKTGTPPRIRSSTINWSILEKQESDVPPHVFSTLNLDRGVKMKDHLITCAKTYTNELTHDIVRKNQHLLPDYDGADGAGVGPRYCPSLFKKVQRFPDRDRHLIWLEPEGLQSDLVYPNGLSGPFPPEIQLEIVRSLPGMEDAEIVKNGYDVEYDYVDPRSLKHTLETKEISGLFLAGQICGTTGYEEAGSQGIIAGANAGLKATGRSPLIINRDEGYIGVLIDDLVTKGTNEPYRMFTSRAEYRLSLRQDNADLRLTEKGIAAGIVTDERKENYKIRKTQLESSLHILNTVLLPRTQWSEFGEEFQMSQRDGKQKSASDVISMPNVTLDLMMPIIQKLGQENNKPEWAHFEVPNIVYETVEATCKYSNYLSRQAEEMVRWRKYNFVSIPADITYNHDTFPSFSSEELEKLSKYKPTTLHEASQLQGVTPHSLVYLQNYLAKSRRSRNKVYTGGTRDNLIQSRENIDYIDGDHE